MRSRVRASSDPAAPLAVVLPTSSWSKRATTGMRTGGAGSVVGVDEGLERGVARHQVVEAGARDELLRRGP